MFFKKTEDLNTAAGYVFLVNEDKAAVDHDLNFLRDVERNAFSLILSDDSTYPELKDDATYLSEIIPMIKDIEKRGFKIEKSWTGRKKWNGYPGIVVSWF